MLRYVKSICGISFALTVTACSTLDNSGIIQHRDRDYPVPDMHYPDNTKNVSIVPPELNHPYVPPVGHFGLPNNATPQAAPAAQDTLSMPNSNYYYDPFTRSATGSGKPIGSIFSGIWPKKNKPQAVQSTQSVSQNTAATASAPSTASNSVSTNTNGQRTASASGITLRSILDSLTPSKSTAPASAPVANGKKEAATQTANSTQEDEKKPKMYYDRFTR
jgi:hypothetical protein